MALGLVDLVTAPEALQVEVDPGTSGWIDAKGTAAMALTAVEQRFGRQDGYLILLFALDVLAPEAIAWQRTLAARLAALPGVLKVGSKPTAKEVVIDELGPTRAPLLDQPREKILGRELLSKTKGVGR